MIKNNDMNKEISERLRKISERLKKEYHAEKVILYGSYARGKVTDESDIDLFVVASTTERKFDRMATVRGLIRDLRRGLPVSPIVFTPEEFIQRLKGSDPFIETIVDEGIVL